MRLATTTARAVLVITLVGAEATLAAEQTWTGQLECSALLVPPANRGPYREPVTVTVSGETASYEFDNDKKHQALHGDLPRSGKLTGEGSWKGQQRGSWTYRFDGKVEGSSYQARGAILSPDGSTKYRDCTIVLTRRSEQVVSASKPSVEVPVNQPATLSPTVSASASKPPAKEKQASASSPDKSSHVKDNAVTSATTPQTSAAVGTESKPRAALSRLDLKGIRLGDSRKSLEHVADCGDEPDDRECLSVVQFGPIVDAKMFVDLLPDDTVGLVQIFFPKRFFGSILDALNAKYGQSSKDGPVVVWKDADAELRAVPASDNTLSVITLVGSRWLTKLEKDKENTTRKNANKL